MNNNNKNYSDILILAIIFSCAIEVIFWSTVYDWDRDEQLADLQIMVF